MGTNKLIESVSDKLKNSEIEEALSILESNSHLFNDNRKNQLTLLRSQFSQLRSKIISDILPMESENINRQKIIRNILEFTQNLKDDLSEEKENSFFKEISPYLILSLIIGIVSAIIIFIIRQL